MLTLTYVVLAALGCGYILVSLMLGTLTDLGAHAHGGIHGASPHGHAGSAHSDYGGGGKGTASASDAGGAAFHFPLFSPLALATLFGCVGAYGLIALHGLGLKDGASLAAAIPAAVITAWLVAWGAFRVAQTSRGTSMVPSDLTGATGEVLTPIPPDGLGEVALSVQGQRYTTAAREEKGEAVPRGTVVRVARMAGPTAIVTRS
jgi:membrane protein implicated in regulation of membrane protease activity